MRLNKFVAHSGIATRRQAGALVLEGKIEVNGQIESNPAYEVQSEDIVTFQGKKLLPKASYDYYLLNKGKNTVAGNVTPDKKRAEYFIKEKAQNLLAIDFMEENDVGLVVVTNDPVVKEKLSDPDASVYCIYQVTLKNQLSKQAFDALQQMVKSNPEAVLVKEISLIKEGDGQKVGIKADSPSLQKVRQLFEGNKLVIDRVDRMLYAGMTKKDLKRGWYRSLNEKEIIMLRHFLK